MDTDDANASFDGITNFDLTAAEEALITADSGTVTFEFFESQNDIDTNTPIANPTTYRNTTPFNQTLLVVVTNTNGCSSVAELRLEVFETISSQDVTFVHYTCDANPNDGVLEGFFDLDAIAIELFTGVSSTFHTSLSDAENGTNTISGTDYLSPDATIYVSVEDGNGCEFIKTFDLAVLPPPSVIDEEEFRFCAGDTAVSIPAPTGNDFYNWYFIGEDGTEELVSADQILVTSESGNYRLFVENEFDTGNQFLICDNEHFFNVIISETPIITDIVVLDFSNENSIEVLVAGSGDYEYALNNGGFQDSNVFEDLAPNTYLVRVRDKNGCGEVSEEAIVNGFPNFFTPNGDNTNESWNAHNPPVSLHGSEVSIFDKYGKLIHQFFLGRPGWDGIYQGSRMPSSDYWYLAKLVDGREASGHFTLKR